VTLRLLVQCDGTRDDRPTMALETCRAFLPVAPRYLPMSQTIDPDSPIDVAHEAGWSQVGGRDLCPSCTRAGNRCAHSSTMRLGDRRVCADCGAPR